MGAKLAPPFVDLNRSTLIFWPVQAPSVQTASTREAVGAANRTGPPADEQGGRQLPQLPDGSVRPPLTTTLSFWTNHPERPWRASSPHGTGPAPSSYGPPTRCQALPPTGEEKISASSPTCTAASTTPAAAVEILDADRARAPHREGKRRPVLATIVR